MVKTHRLADQEAGPKSLRNYIQEYLKLMSDPGVGFLGPAVILWLAMQERYQSAWPGCNVTSMTIKLGCPLQKKMCCSVLTKLRPLSWSQRWRILLSFSRFQQHCRKPWRFFFFFSRSGSDLQMPTLKKKKSSFFSKSKKKKHLLFQRCWKTFYPFVTSISVYRSALLSGCP